MYFFSKKHFKKQLQPHSTFLNNIFSTHQNLNKIKKQESDLFHRVDTTNSEIYVYSASFKKNNWL
jgi:hypothetical protein